MKKIWPEGLATGERRKRIDELLSRILSEKERIDCEHVRRCARQGCHCRRCKAARVK